jgi:hypothetical protein
MFKINDDLSIFVTRGDALVFNLSATTDNGETYIFKPEDMVRIKIMEKKGCDEVVFQKGFTITEETDTVEIALTGEETTIGDVISKPTDYWYEIELNPFTHPQTIIGYDDETGAKIFKLFPEGNSDLKAKDIPIVDSELDLYSDRPVQNQAIAWAVTNAINEMHITTEKAVEDTVTITNEAIAEVNTITENAVNEVHTSNENTLAEVNALVGEVREELQNVPNADNMSNLQTQITENKNSLQEHLQATDPHNIENGLINKGVAEEVATDDKVLVVVDGEIKKTNVENIGVREIEGSNTVGTTTVLKDEWQAMTGLDTSVNYMAVAYGNDRYVCVGASGKSYYSTDGLTWVAMTGLSTANTYYGVTYGNGRFVCVGASGSSYYSTDGLTWQAMSGLDTAVTYRSVTYGNGKFVCVGASGKSYYSTDGLTWQAMSGLNTSKSYNGVTYGNNKFVCVGSDGSSYYSTDGLTWQAMSGLNTSIYYGVTYGNGRYVCVGNVGSSYYSTDGQTWQAMSGLDTSMTYLAVAYGNGKYMCVGQGAKSAYSTDGETWIADSGLDTSANYYRGITYGTEFVAMGDDGVSSHRVYEVETNTETLQGTLQVAGTLLLTKLYAGETTVTISDTSITQDCTLDIYADKYGVNPKNVTVDTGSITLEFKAQESDLNIKVVVK